VVSELKVSIIMPSYNVAQFITESITSVIKQTFAHWELIIIDDCSTDDTVKRVEEFQFDPRITLVKNEKNMGGAGSRNEGIKLAKGRYIAFLDSDDIWKNDKLELQLNFMEQNNYGFTFTSYSTMTEEGHNKGKIETPQKVHFSKLLKHNYIGCLTAMYDTSIFGKIYMPLVRKRQDFALWLELLKSFDYAYGLNVNLGSYRIRTGSLSKSKIDAFKFYWIVLRDVGNCGSINAAYNITCYLFIVFLKKKNVDLYNKLFIR
jgi:teichuronic acid biosynthesis glycosyltransferase TuaG